MSWQVMPEFGSYETATAEFEWELPETYNPATDFLRKGDRADRSALLYDPPNAAEQTFTFGELDDRSDRLAAALSEAGVGVGDRVAVIVPQKPQNPITHLANWKLGAVSVPLTVLFGRDAIEHRLADSDAVAVVVDPSVRGTIEEIRTACPDLETVIELGENVDGDAHGFGSLLDDHEPRIEIHESTPETPTAIMYTSGSTGPPKGVLHSHALWLGRAAAAYNYFEGLETGSDTLWTPADWAWGAALGGTMFAAWHHGCPIVGRPREGFDSEAAFECIAKYDITKAFIPPTALRMLMSVDSPAERWDLDLETIAAAGEPLTPEIVTWVDESLPGVSINEFYGQTELNLVVGNRSSWFDTRPGSMGRPLPGYEIELLDPETHAPVETDEPGEIAVRPGDERVFFNEYWGLPEKTAKKRTDDGWFLTGDLATMDEDGYIWFRSRVDDVILTSGYRIGPMEVEETLLQHSAVEQAGVIGVSDDVRGEAIKAFVNPATEKYDAGTLRNELRSIVRERLAEYEYPRKIEFVDELPQTSTGKIRRATLREREDG